MRHLPKNQDIKKTLLALLERKGETSLEDAIAHVAKKFKVPKTFQKKKLASGREEVLKNAIRWSRWELKREGKVETTRPGYFRLVG